MALKESGSHFGRSFYKRRMKRLLQRKVGAAVMVGFPFDVACNPKIGTLKTNLHTHGTVKSPFAVVP